MFLLLLTNIAYADVKQEVTGIVIGIHDGDTLKILDKDNKQINVRLAEIDAPELKQPYGNKAKKSLSDLVYKKAVTVKVQDIDRYGRSIGHVYVEEIDVNREIIAVGSGWVYRQYLHDESLLQVESSAKKAKKGLWALPEHERMQPWEWRKAQRNRVKKKSYRL